MTDRITIRVGADLAEALDRFIATGIQPFRSRQDAFRHIVNTWLTREGYLPDTEAASSAPEVRSDRRA
ncbi:MAG: hypothetical protein ABS35_36225 [Kaistia sp. SCN 65-12]|jgi:metal-responsive CopG/Arc/MetJ family transcriptional regulator|nr:MAG: hypothetical protein ABS35_36225 [Kaistia sp. SCN 65-12]